MKKIFTRLFALFLLSFVATNAWAQLTELEVGKVYRFVSARADRSLAADGTDDVHVKETNVADTKQEWYVTKDGDYYVLRNVACGKYLKGAYSAYTSWSMTDDYSDEYNKFELYTSNSTLNTLKTKGSDGYGYMHDDTNEDNGGCNVVGWLNGDGNTGSHWTITKVDYTAEQITALLEKAPTVAEIEAWGVNFLKLFNDAACLDPAFGTLAAAQESEDYKSLSSDLQALVNDIYTKCLNDNWAEDNADAAKHEEGLDWEHKYAKKFRVQMYEPYSIAGDITSWLGINAHANNDNPTGIYVPEAGTLYVMVEGTINDGASLRIVDGGHNWRVTNATSGGYELSPGLNVINYTEATGMLYVCYNVDTYNPDGTDDATRFPHKLSEYAPLKIHIEGGAINGFYNAQGDFRATAQDGSDNLWKTISGANVDCDADWVYMETRANLNVLPVLGHRQILLFHLEDWEGNRGMKTLLPDLVDVPTEPYSNAELWSEYEGMGLDASTGKINIMMEAWDRIMYSELATMGLVSEATMKRMNELYPRWENDYTVKHEMYDYENKSSIDGKDYLEFCGVDYSDVFNHHGVALGTESGYMYGGWDHCGYHINTYGGIVQNMANNAGSTWGPAHEIGHQHQALLTLNGLTEVTNNLFSNIALWYKGMSTSRYNGSNGSLESVLNAYNTEGSDIYTNNIWALTHLYYRLWLYYHLAGNNTQFYPRLFELLRHEPMQKGYNVSGDVSTLHFYKLACQAAGEDLTEFFRAHGYFSIMDDRLVGDYSNSVYEVSQEMIDEAIAEVKEMGYEENLAIIFICDDDENATYVQHDGVTKRDIYGETTPNSDFGSVSDFINGNVSVETTYTAALNSDGTLTMSGGEGGVGFLVLNEKGEIVSFSNKSTFAISDEAAYLLATGKASVVAVDTESTTTEAEVDVTAMRFALLQELIENAIALTQNTSETRVGFYKLSAVKNLQGYVTTAQEVIANGDLANLQAVYELLYNEYNAVVANEYSRVTLVPGSKFAIISVKSNDRILTYSGSNVTTVSGNADAYSSTDAYQWYIERDGAYNIKNAGISKYIQDVTDQNGVLYTVGDNKVNMNINEVALGCYTIATSNVPGRYMNMDGANAARIITWGDAYSENSQWAFILLEADATNAVKEELLELSKKTLTLVNEVATVSYNEGSKITLQSDDNTAVNYIWSNAAVSGNNVDKLLDGNKDSFFHSQWGSTTAPSDGWGHHLTVDLGDNPSLTSFKFKFTTRNQSNLSNYPKTIEVYGSADNSTYTKLQVASGFATGAGVDNEALVMGNGTAYRYLRFLVTDATGNNAGTNTGSDGMVFFHMSEFSIYPVTVSATVKSDYTSGVTVDAVLAAYNDAEQAKSVYNNSSATIDDINAKKTALGDGADVAGSYTTLLNQYNSVLNSVLNAKKAQLLTLITNTNSLIESVGSVEFADVPFALTTENLYCNDPCLRNDDDYSADYVTKLTDGNHSTYLHTDWDGSNSAGSAPHYLRVDMGEGETITQFKFSYTTRSNGNNCPTAIVVEGSNDAGGNGTYTTITTLPKDANGLPEDYATFNSETITSTVPYRYIRFRVTATESGDSFFVMSEFSFTKANQPVVTMTNTSTKADEALVFDTYLATAKSQKLHDAATTVALLDAAIADQQAAYDALEKAKNTPADLDKAALQSLYGDALELYNEMADAEGNVKAYYESSALTNEKLIEVKAALDVAKEMLDNGISQTEIDAAKTTLQEQYDALLAIKSSDVTGRDELNALIGDMQSLLGEVADKTTAKTAIALQTTDANAEFYIWSNATAWDCNGIGALIDKNDDGTAKTGTFFGTTWDSGTTVNNYDHYITVDLGTEIALNELSIDYTTRNSTHSNQRPTAIKVLGSNDKEGEYVEITHLSEGMPVGQCVKWEMTSTVALDNYYRYIRFAPATEVGYFNMSDFNLYAHSAVKANDNYSTSDITTAQLFAMNAALLDGIAARDNYVTEENYNTALATLQTQYNALLTIKNANVTDRTSLEGLITQTNNRIEEVATVSEEEAAIAMQCTDENASYYLYCNAPGKTNNYDGDNLGVAALLDTNDDGTANTGTFLHTTYTGDSYDDDLDHYLRLDMGKDKALVSFKFNYVGRVGNTGNAPKTIVVEGSNDRENFEEITTLKNLPTADNATYQSDVITNGKAYRYVRFMVKETSNGSKYKEHQYFALSQFAVTACKTLEVKTEYVSPNLPLSTLVTANNEVVDATVIKNQFYVTETVYDTTEEELQAAYDALNLAKNLKELPVILTTDANNPVLYKIKIKRNENVFTYKGETADASKKPILAAESLGNRYQAWYFMQGTNADSYGDVLIMPYYNEGTQNTTLRLSYANNNDGTEPVVVASETNTTDNWYITFTEGSTTEGWWNLQPEGGMDAEVNAFVNQYGGTNSTKLAFWRNASNPSDPGSQFQFVLDETDYSLSAAYYALYTQHASYSGIEVEAGAEIGEYTQVTADAFNTEFDEAKTLLEAKNATDDEYNAAREELVAAYEALEINMPDPAKYYVLRCNHEDRYIYVNADNKLQWASSSYDKAQSRAVWQFEEIDASNGTCKMKSLHTQSYLQTISSGNQVVFGAEGAAMTIASSESVDGAVVFEAGNNNIGLHAHGSENRVIGYGNGAGANHYFFEEVEVVTGIKHDVTMKTKFSSVTLGYNATVPAGVEAYNAVGLNDGYVSLVKVEGEVIPANTPVILYRTDGDSEAKTFTFTYTDATAEKPASTLLGGSLYTKYVQCDDSDYYKLMIKNGEAKMYLMYKEFDAEGNSQGATHAGGHIKCSANKIYMRVPAAQGIASYGMRFVDYGTTDIDDVKGERGDAKTIYDLQGRKLTEITEPGFYIVDGKKVYVK